MKPVAFDYVRPSTVNEAVGLLCDHADAKILAGGQTLGPMLNLRLAQPALLIDITRIAELAAVTEDADAITIGTTVTHAAIEDGRTPASTHGFLREVARGIGYRAVRTRGTIGGSLAHADPAADWLSCLTALGSVVTIAGPKGTRQMQVAKFARGAMETDLAADELVLAVRVPKLSPRARCGFHKICRKAGEFADAIGVVGEDPDKGYFCAVSGATAGQPLVMDMRVAPNRKALTLAEAQTLLKAARYGGDAYEMRLHAVALQRAYQRAYAT